MTHALTDPELDAIADTVRGVHPVAKGPMQNRYTYVHPFAQAADNLVDFMRNEENRYMFGLRELDLMMRGIGRGELCMVTGRSHSGKTQVVLQAIANNPDKRTVLFTPDEVEELVLVKLIGITRAINAEELERKVRAGDQDAIRTVHSVAAHDFKNLIVIDQGLTFSQMAEALQEAEDMWGAPTDAVIIDYLELMPGEAEYSGTIWKAQELKRWTKAAEVATICLRQNTRSSGGRGQAAGMDGMAYGGEAEATYVIEVFRKRDDRTMDESVRQLHEDTVSVNLAKNKRPPSKKGIVDFHLHPLCGQVTEWDRAVTTVAPSAATGLAAVKAARAQWQDQPLVDGNGEVF